MNRNNRKQHFIKSFNYFQKILKNSGPIITASYGMIGGIIIFMLAGYFLDEWLGTAPWFLITGLLLGIGSGLYEIAKLIWRS
jgi:F0F1-type ATP synthase assembly protein I